MKTFKTYLSSSVGLVLFLSVIALSLPQTGHSSFAAADKEVLVINSSSQPVPVVLQGVPAVGARQSGPWNVGISGTTNVTGTVAISGTPTVEVGNSELAPVFIRDVDRPTARPFMREVVLNVPTGFGGENVDLGIVPGELVVIEQVSAFGWAPTSEVIEQFAILTRVPPDNTYRPHYLDFTSRPSTAGSNAYTVASQQVRIYAGPGSFARVARLGSAAPLTFRFVLSGYYANE